LIPGHASQQHAHAAGVGQPGEDQSSPDKSRQAEKGRVEGSRSRKASIALIGASQPCECGHGHSPPAIVLSRIWALLLQFGHEIALEGGLPMSAIITVEEAQARLKEVIDKFAPGGGIVITENRQPMAKLVGECVPQPSRPAPGVGKGGTLYMASDFDEALQEHT
jgi:antitoxin (DNA-binding transcriptional repressor) of toxin-antitoxin stability system